VTRMFHPAGIVSPIFVPRAWCHLVVETELVLNPDDPSMMEKLSAA
jgi:hypothetical protein